MPDVQDATAASSTAQGKDNGKDTGTEDLDQLPADAKAETKDRFQKLLDDRKTLKDRVQAYEQLGSPEEIATLKEKVGQIDTLNARIMELEHKREPGEAKTDEQKNLESFRAKAKAEIRDIDDGIVKGEQAHSRAEYTDSARERIALRATVAILKEHGMSASDDEVNEWGTLIAATIQNNEELSDTFLLNPKDAVRTAFERRVERFAALAQRKTDAQKQKDKEKITALPKSHGGGGGTDNKTIEPPKTVAEGVKRAMTIWRGQAG